MKNGTKVKAIKDLFWSDGENNHLHCKAGEGGEVTCQTKVGVIIRFNNGEQRQILEQNINDEVSVEETASNPNIEEPIEGGWVPKRPTLDHRIGRRYKVATPLLITGERFSYYRLLPGVYWDNQCKDKDNDTFVKYALVSEEVHLVLVALDRKVNCAGIGTFNGWYDSVDELLSKSKNHEEIMEDWQSTPSS